MKNKNPIVRLTGQASAVILLASLMMPAARAANAYWGGVPGVNADTNWSDAANWPEPPGTWSYSNGGDGPTFYNEVYFNGVGANPVNDFAVNNVLDTTSSGAAVMPVWELDITPTNGNYTTLINPGVTLQIAAGNGTVRVGADSQHTTSAAPANAVETIKFEGPGGTFNMDGSLYVGQGSVTPNDTHNVTFDLSGLDNFVMLANGNYIYLASSAAANANGVLYLAKTNNIALGNGIQMCNGATNSQPVMLYLGINNSITLGSSGNFNIGQTGTTTNGAIVEFNPAFLGGATPPTAVFNSAANGGRINNFYVGNANQSYAANAVCNLSGGSISALISTLQVALAGGGGAVTGALTCDMGILNASSANVGVQQSSGAMAVGTVNINSNSTYGASASLIVGGTLSLATVTGTLTPGTAGTININGGTLSAANIVNGAGAGTLNVAGGTLTLSGSGGTAASPISTLSLSNSTVNLTISAAPTNIFAGTLLANGVTNVINITTAPLFPSYPATISLIKYQGSIGGSGYNFGLGTVPNLYAGHLVNNTANGSVDLVFTSGPSAETWTDGAGNNDWDTTSANWSGATTKYVDGDGVQFLDGAASGLVNLTANFLPNSVTVSNNALAYTWSSIGSVGGATALTKKGPGTFVIDNSGNNSFSGGVTISGGILQVGNNDTSGNLPAGTVTDNGVLVYDRTDSLLVNSDTISGTGAVIQAGGGTLQLAGGNTFSGTVGVTNNSTLQLGGSTAAGTGTNDIIVASGSTLDVNGYTATKPVIISGAGLGGNGALISSGGAVYDNPGPAVATNITLAADTTFTDSSPNRWDLGSRNGTTCVLSGAYNLTINGNSYFEWANLQVNNLENITLTSGTMGIIGNTTFGNPAGTLALTASASLDLYGANNFVNKAVDFQSGATINNSSSANVMTGPMTMEPGVENLNISSGTSLTLSNSLSGSGILVQNTGTGSSALSGNSPSFTGGVVLYTGNMALNGLIGSGITSSSGTTLSGTGTADGLVDVSGAFTPGGASAAGTFNAAGGLTIEGGASMTMNLGTTTTAGGGVNSLVNVTGNLTFNANNFNISINPYEGYLANGTYTLFNYTGTLTVNGTLTASPASPSVYTFTIVTNATQVLLTVSGQGDLVAWNNNANNGQWDVSTSVNWTNRTTLTNSVYLNPDTVVFDNTITNSATPTTSITIPASTVVVPATITNNSTTNYTITGGGQIAGGASIIKMGPSTLTIATANTFDGNTIIGAGALQINGQVGTGTTPLGATNGSIVISNGATLYVNLTGGYPAGDAGFAGKPIIISGAGVNGQGAIQNIGNALYDDGSTLGLGFNVTMASNATIGGSSRLDWGYPGTGTTLSTSGSNYNLTVIENQYFRWDNFSMDTNLGNIDVYSSGGGYEWEVDGMGAGLGNPTNILTVHSNVQMQITDSSVGSYPGADDSGYAKVIHVQPTAAYVNNINGGTGDYRDSTSFILDGGSLFNYYNGTGGNNSGTAFSGTVLLNGLVDFEVGNSLLTFSNVISGPGGFYMSNYGGNPPLTFAAANTYTGITDIRSGNNFALIGNGSISDSTPISLATGALLITTNRVDGTLTLTSGQTLEGVGTVQGALVAGAGSTLLPGITSISTNVGTLSVSGNASLAGAILMKLNNSSSDNLAVGGSLTYGGTLTVTNISATPLAAGNSFKLFTAASYSGSFGSISPASPGAGLSWNTSSLAVNGTLSVVSLAGPKITSIAVNGTTLTIMANNGPANGQFILMESTNLLTPLPWTPVLTNNFGNTGTLNLSTNIIRANTPDEYYILQVAQ